MPFEIVRNDITQITADAIVNTANPEVCMGNGVIPFGEVKVTPAYKLNAKYIFHASGPVWIDGKHNERAILKKCYDECMKLAIKKRCKSIAFPFIATGSYGFPRDEAIRIAISVFGEYLLEYDIQIYLVVFDKKSYDMSTRLFSDVDTFINEHYVNSDKVKPRPFSESQDGTYILEFASKKKDEQPKGRLRSSQFHKTNRDLDEGTVILPVISESNPAINNLDSYLQRAGKTLAEYLQQLINKKGLKNAEVYKRANMDKKYFSKLITGKAHPTKLKLLSIAIALELNLDETKDLLLFAGYALSPSSKSDLIFEYYIRNGEYDIFTIDITLFDYGLPTVIND